MDMDQVSSETVRDIVNSFTAALKNFSLYPMGHPAVQKSMAEMNEKFEPFLSKNDLIIAIVDNNLVVAGDPCLEEKYEFYKSLKESMIIRGVEKIVFYNKLEPNEVVVLLQHVQIGPPEPGAADPGAVWMILFNLLEDSFRLSVFLQVGQSPAFQIQQIIDCIRIRLGDFCIKRVDGLRKLARLHGIVYLPVDFGKLRQGRGFFRLLRLDDQDTIQENETHNHGRTKASFEHNSLF